MSVCVYVLLCTRHRTRPLGMPQWAVTTLSSGRSELDEKGEYYSKNHTNKYIITKWDKCSEREEYTHKKTSHKRIWKNGEVGSRNKGSRQDGPRQKWRTGRLVLREHWLRMVCLHTFRSVLVAHLFHKSVRSTQHMHWTVPGTTDQQEQNRQGPCTRKALMPANSLQRGTASWMRIQSLNFVTCCQTTHFGVWSALPEATCALGEQNPQSSFLTKSGSLAQRCSLLSQSGVLGSRSCLRPEGCHILTAPRA